MDPNETLRLLREAITGLFAVDTDNASYDPAVEIAERFQALDEWLSKGGFLPTDWVAGYRTKSGRVLSDTELNALAAEAERGYSI